MKLHTLRLKPGQDLKQELQRFVNENDIRAGFVATCVGSLDAAILRMAGAEPNKQDVRKYTEKHEIVSLVGTLSKNGSHLHIAISDKEGHVIGGHLRDGYIISTTAEIVIGEIKTLVFKRLPDEETGFEELAIEITNGEQ